MALPEQPMSVSMATARTVDGCAWLACAVDVVSDMLLELDSGAPPLTNVTNASPRPQMLDLTIDGVKKRWSDHGVARLIAAMEQCEPWAVDVDPRYVEQAEVVVKQIEAKFNAAHSDNVLSSVQTAPSLTIEFMGYLRSGRALALFAWLAQEHPEIPRLLINEARGDADSFGSLLIERITTLEKQHLLSRVFSPERIALVLDLLDEAGVTAG